jgi:hypothetical protein
MNGVANTFKIKENHPHLTYLGRASSKRHASFFIDLSAF